MTHTIVVFVTCPTKRQAKRLAQALVKQRLAACVNLLPDVQSLFWWEGRVDQAREVLLLIKTTARRFEALRRTVCALHPYGVPEVIAVPIRQGHPPYLRWVQASVAPPPLGDTPRGERLASCRPRHPRTQGAPGCARG